MPIGIISDTEFELELLQTKSSAIVHTIERGRGSVREVPDSVRAFIAQEALEGATAREISTEFNISPSSISAYKNGATSTATYNKPNEKLAGHIKTVKERITKKASNRLIRALNGIDDDKLQALDGKELAGVAKDMASIVEKMGPKVEQDDKPQIVLHLYTPKQKSVNDYEVIEVSND